MEPIYSTLPPGLESRLRPPLSTSFQMERKGKECLEAAGWAYPKPCVCPLCVPPAGLSAGFPPGHWTALPDVRKVHRLGRLPVRVGTQWQSITQLMSRPVRGAQCPRRAGHGVASASGREPPRQDTRPMLSKPGPVVFGVFPLGGTGEGWDGQGAWPQSSLFSSLSHTLGHEGAQSTHQQQFGDAV